MKQIRIKNGPLLDENGNLKESGYNTFLIKEYDRNKIKANKLRIKEWDYYYIGNNEIGLALTIADNSYMGLHSISYLNFKTKEQITKSVMTFMPKGKTKLPATSVTGDVKFKNKKIDISFLNDGNFRMIHAYMPNFKGKEAITIDLILDEVPRDSMVIATPFDKPKHFYYNQKINCLHVSGTYQIGNSKYELQDALAVLDWGRGVWTYKNTWYWSSLSAMIDDHKIGFNLGYGFGCNNNASENMLFLDGQAYKVDEVEFNIPQINQKDNFMDTWHIRSNDGKVDLLFEPILDRFADTNAILIRSCQHQVFGKFNGILKFDDTEIQVKDKIGFAEKVYNKW